MTVPWGFDQNLSWSELDSDLFTKQSKCNLAGQRIITQIFSPEIEFEDTSEALILLVFFCL